MDVASQELLAILLEVDPVATEEWTRKIDAIWERYSDIASRLAEHKHYDDEAIHLFFELDREIGVPLLKEVRLGLPEAVVKKMYQTADQMGSMVIDGDGKQLCYKDLIGPKETRLGRVD